MLQNKFTEQISHRFPPDIKGRGKYLYSSNAISFLKEEHNLLYFQDSNDPSYAIQLSVSSDQTRMSYSCTCHYFRQINLCPHVWGALLLLENQNILGHLPNGLKSHSNWKIYLTKATQELETSKPPFNLGSGTLKKPLVGSYCVDIDESVFANQVCVKLYSQERLKGGRLNNYKQGELTAQMVKHYGDAQERELLQELVGKADISASHLNQMYRNNKYNSFYLVQGHGEEILKKIFQMGKLLITEPNPHKYYRYYKNAPKMSSYEYLLVPVNLKIEIKKENEEYIASGKFVADDVDSAPENFFIPSDVHAIIDNFIFFKTGMARSSASKYKLWYQFVKNGDIKIPKEEIRDFLKYFFSHEGNLVDLELPDELQFDEIRHTHPQVRLIFSSDLNSNNFSARIEFNYGNGKWLFGNGHYAYDMDKNIKIFRDLYFEKSIKTRFLEYNPFISENQDVNGFFTAEKFIKVAESAIADGWEVLVENKKMNLGYDFKMSVSSGVDWFDLDAEFKIGDETLHLPQLLEALRSGTKLITLGNGETGILPEKWFQQLMPFAEMGKKTEDGIRLNKVQALFLNASQMGNQELTGDKKFTQLRELLTSLSSIVPTSAGNHIKGELREYQESGLAWLEILSENQIGGILADDMGLGKTIQILALISKTLSQKNSSHDKALPSLIVAPKSLLFNWKSEAAKFTPHLKVYIHSGSTRMMSLSEFIKYDLIITTYQTLRIDIEVFKEQKFLFFILDEAHYIKNSQSQINMAARLIRAEKIIAMTGTPVENSLADLFSILAIVLPGLISEASAKRWVKESDPEKIKNLANAIRPFLLRRTKEQVLKDLPEKSEQILYCELSTEEKTKYDDLKKYYWNQITGKIKEKGLANSKFDVLEALLRLRQAACHQGLLTNVDIPNVIKGTRQSSAKFELLLEQLETALTDGHKALVFSQFTSLLKLFSKELDERKIQYEYLDGSTNRREDRVHNFQTNKSISVFLISLKAGGVGLNLTAADYVYILDPWWNPAAESQAIDRAHRIGQEKKVFSYKIIAKDTVEEKILELQNRKKDIANAIVNENMHLLKTLKMEDLKELFS